MEQNDKYEARVRQMAIEISKITNPLQWKRYGISHPDLLDEIIDKYIPIARLAVQREAEAIKMGMVAAIFWGLNESNIADKLVHDGYIHSPNQPEQ